RPLRPRVVRQERAYPEAVLAGREIRNSRRRLDSGEHPSILPPAAAGLALQLPLARARDAAPLEQDIVQVLWIQAGVDPRVDRAGLRNAYQRLVRPSPGPAVAPPADPIGVPTYRQARIEVG